MSNKNNLRKGRFTFDSQLNVSHIRMEKPCQQEFKVADCTCSRKQKAMNVSVQLSLFVLFNLGPEHMEYYHLG